MSSHNNTYNRIVYIYPKTSSFIRQDIRLLEKKYQVITNTYNWDVTYLVPFYLIHQLIILPFHFFSAQAVIISFGGYWSLIPTLLGKVFSVKTLIILNGSDCASFPKLRYGMLRKPVLRQAIKWSYSLATKLLPVSESLVYSENSYFNDREKISQGYQYFFPNITTEYEIVFNGLDPDIWFRDEKIDRSSINFMSVFSDDQFVLKGGELILEISKKITDCTFYIGGCKKPPDLKGDYPNVLFLDKLKPEELRYYYNKCQFYLQLSVFEGFGMALCEAMACECIPIGSNVNLIPEIIGDTGYIVHKRDVSLVQEILNSALNCENMIENGKRARRRIIDKFHIRLREKALLRVIEN